MNSPDPATLARLMGLMCDAIALRGAQQAEAALAALDQALALDPSFLPLYMQRAGLLQEMGALPEAIAACAACLDLAPDYDEARALHRSLLQRWATQCELKTADEGPSGSAALIDLARARLQLDQPLPALAAVERALASGQAGLALHALHADILLRLNRHEEALECYPPAADEDQARALHAFNMADILRRMGRIEQAQAAFEQALRWHPDFPEAEVGRAHMLLSQQHYAEGWRAHEARFGIAELARRGIDSPRPRWRAGEEVRGKRVLLWAEQGQGDTLQFARYIPLVVQQAAEVSLCAPASLLAVLAPCLPQVRCMANPGEAPDHDLHASLLSLPLLLGLPDPRQGPSSPYLAAQPQRVQQWQAYLSALWPAMPRRPRIGIAWAGRQYATVHHSRDIPLNALAPLWTLPADFVSLQVEVPAGDQAAHATLAQRLHTPTLADWADTAALLCALDLVISVDTAVVHLAGALGVPCLLPLRYDGEWRWGVKGSQTPWYPSLQLLRQRERGQWGPVVEEMLAVCTQRLLQPK
ncbi:tetratricopeptide repeat protein [Herbaspirillum seropedicae]|uniref:tetratricopeptide repeat protein n=1 Tax=Herbaspirillum seropedicae TaxID=964 RepID=UPI003D951E93